MARINVNLSKIKYNAKVLQTVLERKNIHFTPVVKCVAGDKRIVSTIESLGITHFAESRLDNIERLKDLKVTFTLLRAPSESEFDSMISNVEISIQTELGTIRKLNTIAKRLSMTHQIMLMIDWKDGREGVLTYDMIDYVNEIQKLSHIELVGIAFNFMCFKSLAPDENDIFMMNQFVTAIEQEMGYKFKVVSGGNSSMLPQTMYNNLGEINDLRIGEALIRGVDTTTYKPIASLYQDAIVLEAEIIEIKPRLNQGTNQSYLQAIVDIGYLDTFTDGIQPVANEIKIIGASSDHLMIDLNNQDHYKVGDRIQFSLNYEALSQSMYMKNLTKTYIYDSKIQTLIENFNTPEYSRN